MGRRQLIIAAAAGLIGFISMVDTLVACFDRGHAVT
jgi:hypothetical protein